MAQSNAAVRVDRVNEPEANVLLNDDSTISSASGLRRPLAVGSGEVKIAGKLEEFTYELSQIVDGITKLAVDATSDAAKLFASVGTSLAALIRRPELAVAAAGIGLTALPNEGNAAMRPEGSNDADFKALATQVGSNSLWICYTRPNGSTNYASAIRINSNYALTAGHVMLPSNGESNILTHVGTGSNYSSSPGDVRAITSVTLHPQFIRNNHEFPDAVIVRVDQPLPGPDLKIATVASDEIVTLVGHGKAGTPGGPLVQDGFERAWKAPKMNVSLQTDGYADQFYFACNFGPEFGPMNGKGLPGDSGGENQNDAGDGVGMNIAQIGNSAPIGYTISLRLSAIKSWIEEVTTEPKVRVAGVGTNGITLAWSTNLQGFSLEAAPEANSTNWTAITNVTEIVGNERRVTVTFELPTCIFRLKKMP